MSENRATNAPAVDRRDEAVIAQGPGSASTEQRTGDVAAVRRPVSYQLTRIIWAVLAILEITLGLRYVLKLIAGSASSGFAVSIYGITKPFVAPFEALVATPTFARTAYELSTLIAMAMYVLVAWAVVRVIGVAAERVTARTVTRSTREETPGGPGNELTTQHTRN
jgi:hypothetical protein